MAEMEPEEHVLAFKGERSYCVSCSEALTSHHRVYKNSFVRLSSRQEKNLHVSKCSLNVINVDCISVSGRLVGRMNV